MIRWILFFCFPLLNVSAQTEILHYTETTGFDHSTRSVSLTLFEELGDRLGFSVVSDNDGSNFNSVNNLGRFSLVIFSNTSGDNGLSNAQRENFEQYIAGGGSYLGIHAASDTYRHSSANGGSKGRWDWYAETVAGCSVQQGPNHTANNFNADMQLIESNTVLDSRLPNPWNKEEEWYYWENGYLNNNAFQILLEVEQTGNQSYDAPRMAAHYRELPGGGKAFYTSMGHEGRNFSSDTNFRQLMENALSWILGKESTGSPLQNELKSLISPRWVNPSSGEWILFAEVPLPMDLQLEIVDLTGRLVDKYELQLTEAGEIRWREKWDKLEGWYLLRLSSESYRSYTEKVFLEP